MFFSGKLRLFQIRLIYENLEKRSMENFLLHSRITDIPSDSEEEYEEMIYKVASILNAFKNEIEVSSLPCEKRYFKERGYKSQQLRKDQRTHLREFPKDKSIETILEFKGYTGSNLFRYISNRIMFFAAKEEDYYCASQVINEIEELERSAGITEESDDEQIKALQREMSYRQKMISQVINSRSKDLTTIDIERDKLKRKLERQLYDLDVQFAENLTMFEEKVQEKAKQNREEIHEIIRKHKEQQFVFEEKLKEISRQLGTELESTVEAVKGLKPFTPFEINKIMSQIHYLKESIEKGIADRDTFFDMYEEFSDLAKHLEKSANMLSEQTYKGVNVQGVAEHLNSISQLLDKQVADYERIFTTINSELQVGQRQLKKSLKGIEGAILEGSTKVLKTSRSIAELTREDYLDA